MTNEEIITKVNTFFDSAFNYCYGVISLRKESNPSLNLEIEIKYIEDIKKIAINSNSVESLFSRKSNKDDFNVQYLFSKSNINSDVIKSIDFKGDFDFFELHVISSEDKLENPIDEIIYYYFDLLSARDYEKYGDDIFYMWYLKAGVEIDMLDIEYYRNLFNELSISEQSRCGLVYELYQRRLSNEIDRCLNNLNQDDKAKVLELAKSEFDYLSPKEIEIAIESDYMNGLCSHGLDPDCCPMGCGEF